MITRSAFTYDHRILKIELPVRSAVLKQCTGGLVVRWVTTGEYPLLYVFLLFFGPVRKAALVVGRYSNGVDERVVDKGCGGGERLRINV
jgi:hypothetical protein